MGFKDFPDQQPAIQLLQRSLERGRLGHGYLFAGHHLEPLEGVARVLAKTLNCLQPVKRAGAPVDACDRCLSCKKIDHDNHPDIHWLRPESKTRIITVAQMRELLKEIHLKPTEAVYKVAVIVCADRLKTEAANAFLKTLEEPPPKSILILLSTEPQRILETILSRCLRLNFGGGAIQQIPPEQVQWLAQFSQLAAAQQKSLLGRYRLMDVLVCKLNQTKAAIEKNLTARSPIQQYQDTEPDLLEKWEAELAAAVEAEYRRQRADLLATLQCWLRDIWIQAILPNSKPPSRGALLHFPELPGTKDIASRLSPAAAMENVSVMEQLQRWLYTNVQEALALEVGMLKLRL